MQSKTPKFDEALNEILENLAPHSKICKECQKEFEIMAEDIKFYKKLQVPSPTLCFECRFQRKLGYRITSLPIFYKKSCSVPNHNEKIIAYFSEKNSIKVYDDEYYHSDNWEATEFSQDFDLEEEFFNQYKNFSLNVPHQALFKDPQSVNSDYVISGFSAKDCYYVTSPYFSESIYYGSLPVKCRECINNIESQECEKCFDIISSQKCYNCKFCLESSDCLDSAFLYDCKNCQNCFMSSNLRNKQYYFCNKKLSKEAYENKMQEIDLGRKSIYETCKKEFDKMILNSVHKNVVNVKVEQCTGNGIFNSKKCFYSFLCVGCENNRYVSIVDQFTDSMDVYGGARASKMYETSAVDGNNTKFSITCRNAINLEYCSECNNCENCFGCLGLKNKKFHIFNKPYSEEEYWQKVDELKTKMLERKEYGEFFPLKDSPFPYQDSNAQVEFPLTEQEIKEKRWHWQDEIKSDLDLSKMDVLESKDIPDDIKEIDDNILKKAIICERTNKPFKVTPYELEFYKKMNVPLPTIHPIERIKDLFKYRRPYKLYNTNCTKCNVNIQTVHKPEKTKNIYCEECYLEAVV